MDSQQKIYATILALEEASKITSSGKPILLHYEARYLENIPKHELIQILEKLAEDEKIIRIIKIPQWVKEAVPMYYGPLEIEDSFKIELLAKFKKYLSKFHLQFKDYIYNADKKCFEKLTSKRKSTLSTKEKDTLLKLILGMAIRGYTYDPNHSRNSAIGDITKDLQELGIPLDRDTIRKWLKEAALMHSVNDPNHNT